MKVFLLKAAAFVLGHLPRGLALGIGRSLGRLGYRVAGKHRKIALDNLERAFGDSLTPAEKEAIAKKVFENLSSMLFEFTRIPWLNRERLDGIVECEGIERLNAALKKEKGVIVITGHMGNWELMAAYLALNGYIMDIVVRDPDSPAFDSFIRWVRSRPGNRIISKHKSMRKLLKRLSENGIAGILVDQNVTHSEGFFVDYFGTLACANKGPALLAAASGAVALPVFIVREGDKHRIIIKDEIALTSTGDKERDAIENTAKFTKAVEDIVREHPSDWFWVHRRWKTRPRNT